MRSLTQRRGDATKITANAGNSWRGSVVSAPGRTGDLAVFREEMNRGCRGFRGWIKAGVWRVCSGSVVSAKSAVVSICRADQLLDLLRESGWVVCLLGGNTVERDIRGRQHGMFELIALASLGRGVRAIV